jgi:hypothetical protein
MKTLSNFIYLPGTCSLSGPCNLLGNTSYVHHYFIVSNVKKIIDVIVNLNCASFGSCMIVVNVISNLNTSLLCDVYWCEV